jgi:hypothetical protein
MLSEESTRRFQEDYDRYQRMNEDVQLIHPVAEEISLRIALMLRWYMEDMEERLRWVERQDWTKEYKAMFARAARWRKDAFNGGAEKLYRLSHKYRNVPNAEEYGYVWLSGNLLYRAALAGHPKARLEFKDHPAQPAPPSLLEISRGPEYQDAVEDRPEAKEALVIYYLLHPIFDDDRVKGYYWLLRVRDMGVSEKLRDQLLKALSFLTESQREQARGWIESGYVPPM